MGEVPRFVLGVDLDGVCADFYRGLRTIAAEWTGRPLDAVPEVVSYSLPEWNLVAWLDTHGIPYWDLCFMRDKAEVGANLYVEDAPENVEAMRKAGLATLVFTNSTNLELDPPRADSWDEVVEFVLKARDTWHAARR